MEKLRELIHLFVTVFLSSFGIFIVIPAITDVTMQALCPGQDQCSLAIYLSGFQQAVIGIGSVVAMPIIGSLSDKYGRKTLLTVPLTVSIIPLAILAYSRTTNYFYAYYVLKTLTAMVSQGSVSCLAFAYVADKVSERERASAFGVVSGITLAAFVFGTIASRFLSTALTYQVATLASMLAVMYMRIFLKDSVPGCPENLTQPILRKGPDDVQDDGDLPRKAPAFKNVPSVRDLVSFLKTSATFWQAAIVAFFSSLEEGGWEGSMTYYFKARFHFGKNQFADVMFISGVAGMISQLIFMPLLAPVLAEQKLLSIGLLVGCINMILYSISWSAWVPYAVPVLNVFVFLVPPCIRSIASKQVGPTEQGMAQGCIAGIYSFANIIAPLIFSPLTALFLSEDAPFNFPGFSILCLGFAMMIAFIQSVLIRNVPPISSHKICSNNAEA